MAKTFGLLGRLSNVQWSLLPTEKAADDKRLPAKCDPYLVWFDSTCVQSSASTATQLVDLLLELPADLKQREKVGLALTDLACRFRFPPPVKGSSQKRKVGLARFVTASLPWIKLSELVDIREAVGVVRFELASARYLPVFKGGTGTESIDKRNHLAKSEFDENIRLLKRVSEAWKPEINLQSVGGGSKQPLASIRAPNPMLLVIDDFCNFSSTHLQGSIRTVWHQGKSGSNGVVRRPVWPVPRRPGIGPSPPTNNSSPWEYQDPPPAGPDSNTGPPSRSAAPPEEVDSPGRENYGAILDFSQNAGLALLGQSNEVEAYRQAEYHLPTPSWSHGTAVLSLLSSAGLNPAGTPSNLRADNSSPMKQDSYIHFVQLPERAVLDTSGGSLAGFAIDAIHRAVRMAAKNHHDSVVVNLSYGTHSGPHDGSSMFEAAMLDLLEEYDGQSGRPELHVVLPAGNSHLLRCHASGWLSCLDSERACQTLNWRVLPDDDTDSFVELWFSQGANVSVELISPSKDIHLHVTNGYADSWTSDQGADAQTKVLNAAIVFPESAAQGGTGPMALIAVAPTLRRRDYGHGERYRGSGANDLMRGIQRVRMEAQAGVWQIRLRNLHKTAAAGFNAWVQRDDAAPGRSRASKGYRGRQSYFLDPPQSAVDPRFTLNGIATAVHPGRRLWVVGSMDECGRISRYSSAGPDRDVGNRCIGPDVVTVADGSRNNPGITVGGTFSGSRLRLPGTSISAAVFARMLHDSLKKTGPFHKLAWSSADCQPHPLSPSPVAGEPEQASDFFRGELVKLRHAKDIFALREK